MADFIKNSRLEPVKRYRKMHPQQNLELKSTLVLLCALLTIYLMAGFMETGGAVPSSSDLPSGDIPKSAAEGIIRFHVIANSDEAEDQELKLEVRNQVLSRIQIQLADEFAREISEAGQAELTEDRRLALTRSWLEANLKQIEIWAAETIAAEGFDDSIRANLGITWIPDREYDGIYFPSGNYEALTLTIGQGAGQNWWCVIYPPLCLIDSSDALREELGEARFQAWLDSLGGSRIILKSRVAELLKAKKN